MPYRSRLRAEKVLSDGRQLRLEWTRVLYPATREEPEEVDDVGMTLYVDDVVTDYDEPSEDEEFSQALEHMLDDGGEAVDSAGDEYEPD